MKFNFYCIVLSVFLWGEISAQNDYHPLKCTGSIPEDFTLLAKEKGAQEIKEEKSNSKSASSIEQRKKDNFIRISNYLIDEILVSGRVLFNDPISAYLNKIADAVLVNEPDLRAKIRIYVLRSNEVNAFTTNSGIIFVTSGLVAEVENEAQLAFVLSHEIIHYEKKHVINAFIENERIFTQNNRYEGYNDKIKKASSFSKDLEIEADRLGLRRLAGTHYDLKECLSSMDVLQFSHLPFDEVKFDLHRFETQNMKLPLALYLDSVKPIDFSGDVADDVESTHPNIKTRIESLQEEMKDVSTPSVQSKFIQSQDEFLQIRKIARYETVRMLLSDRQYAEAIYEAYVLLNKDPNNLYLKESIAKGMYGMAKYKQNGSYSDISRSYKKYEGEMQQSIFLFEKLSGEQLTFLACKELYELSLTSDNNFIKRLRDDLFYDLISEYDMNLEKLKIKNNEAIRQAKNDALEKEKEKENEKNITSEEGENKDVKTVEDENSKYDKLRKQKKEVKSVETGKKVEQISFQYTAFADYIDSKEFADMYEEIEDKVEKDKRNKKQEEEADEKLSASQKRSREAKEEKEIRKKGKALGLNKVVFVDPFYLSVDNTKGSTLENSEQKQINFSKDVTEVSEKAGLKTDILTPKIFTHSDVDKYNQLAAVNFWISERLDHENIKMIPLESEYISTVSDDFGTKNFAFSGILSFKEKKDQIALALLSIITVYTAPWGIYYILSPNWNTYFYTLVFNVETGDCYMNEQLEFDMKESRSLLRSQLYDLFIQMKRD